MTGTDRTRRSRVFVGLTAGLLAMAGTMVVATPAAAAPPGCDTRNNNTVAKLLECVTVEGVRAHQQAFQTIADANGGTRASGTPGYDASVDYVAEQAAAAGLTVTRQEFDFPFFQLLSESLAQLGPVPTTYEAGTAPGQDFKTMTYSGSGNVTGTAVPVDLVLPPGPSTSGCNGTVFPAAVAGNIALIQRGTCSFAEKATNAQAAGATGVIIFNRGVTGQTDVFGGTLGGPGITIPVVGTSFAVGVELQNATVALNVRTDSRIAQTENIIAKTTGGRTAGNVVMVGAHLDSVIAGPGINDNGSGSAAILEVAKLIAKSKPTNTIRFAWWGAEELGLLGSTHYVDNLSDAELADIAAYLNFDMVGSPNFARFVYDGDNSDGVGAGPGPAGSAAIEDLFEKFYADRGLAYEGTDFDGRSDYGPFIAAGIPAGGLFTGAEGIKTPAQAARYGGSAGVAFDPCYHQACDTFVNVSLEVLDQNADSIAFVTLTLAYDTSLVNDVAGRPAPGSARNAAPGGQAAA